MKRFLACLLAMTMILASHALAAEDAFTVGSTTKLSGSFFTDMWGSNTSDIDVRMLLHGYSPMQWKSGTAEYVIDDFVVDNLAVADSEQGTRTYTVTLADDLKFSDGTPVTARDYAFSILLSLAPQTQAIGGAVDLNSYILGAQAYTAGQTQTLSGVRLVDEYTFSVTVQASSVPYFYEMGLLDFNPYPIGVIAPGCEVADDGEGVYIRNENPIVLEPIFTAELLEMTVLDSVSGYRSHPSVVSGPYVLVSYDAESGIAEFEDNPYFKGNSLGMRPAIRKLVLRPVTNENMFELFESGEVDLINKVTQKDAIDAGLKLVKGEDALAGSYDRSGLSFVSFSCERPATGSRAVRQAIAHCFDKDAFVRGYVGEYGTRVDGWYGMGQWVAKAAGGSRRYIDKQGDLLPSLGSVKVYEKSTREAEKLLEQDGWTAGEDGIREKNIGGELVRLDLTMICPEGNQAAELFDRTLVKKLEKVGVKLTIQEVPFPELLKVYYRQTERECDMIYLASNFELVFDAVPMFSVSDANVGRTNRSGIADAHLEQLAEDLNRTQPGDLESYLTKCVTM